VSRYNADKEQKTYPVIVILLTALAQCCGTRLIEARKLSRCIEFKLRAMARIRVHVAAGFVLGAVSGKNHDEPINYTVRVRYSCI